MFLANLKRLGLADDQNILLMDGHGSHSYNLPFIDDMFTNNVHITLYEPHTT